MSKSLIIAEKPSVAQDIVRALTPVAGKFEKLADHFENDRYVVTSAVGHLVEIKAPDDYDVKRGKWSFANLPVAAALRPGAHRQDQGAPDRGGQAGQAQGRDRADQRL
jgi:DNA topoisomerase IA